MVVLPKPSLPENGVPNDVALTTDRNKQGEFVSVQDQFQLTVVTGVALLVRPVITGRVLSIVTDPEVEEAGAKFPAISLAVPLCIVKFNPPLEVHPEILMVGVVVVPFKIATEQPSEAPDRSTFPAIRFIEVESV